MGELEANNRIHRELSGTGFVLKHRPDHRVGLIKGQLLWAKRKRTNKLNI